MTMDDINVTKVLACPMDPETNDAGASTVRQYLATVLEALWIDENVNGKRVFGNSSWHYEVYQALVHEGLVIGCFDEDGYLESLDERMALASVLLAIRSLA